MSHWAVRYIGTPWSHGDHDCWGFFRSVQLDQFGRSIPAFPLESYKSMACARAVAGNPERSNWIPVDKPEEGDAVLMAHAKHPSHVGVWISADGGKVLHCVNGPGVVAQTVSQLKLSGWGHLEYYRHI